MSSSSFFLLHVSHHLCNFYGCSLVAYCKMNNICDEEGEANGGVFVGDSIVLISSVSFHFSCEMGFPAFLQHRLAHPKHASFIQMHHQSSGKNT